MGRRALVAIALLAMTGVARAQSGGDGGPPDTERYTLRAELGVEYDSNAHRTEVVAGAVNPPLVGSALERLVLAGTLSDVVADGQMITLGATAAGKIYDANAASDEDVAIAQSSLAWAKAFSPRATLTLAGAYYEAFQAEASNPVDAAEQRDFRSLAPTAQIGWIPAPGFDLSLSAGYRWFVFKPDRDDNFTAPTAAAELRWTRPADEEADWEASTGAAYEHRSFGGPALVISCPPSVPAGLACSGPDQRQDQFLMTHVELQRTGHVLIGVGYAFHYNLSDSYGETVMRHFLTARFAAPLPGGLTLAARGELLYAHYPQGTPIGTIAVGNSFSSVESIEDENRSSVRVDLSRDLTEQLRLVARYTFYVNELGNPQISYLRQTILLSLTGILEK
jgi:hypothetical protein